MASVLALLLLFFYNMSKQTSEFLYLFLRCSKITESDKNEYVTILAIALCSKIRRDGIGYSSAGRNVWLSQIGIFRDLHSKHGVMLF